MPPAWAAATPDSLYFTVWDRPPIYRARFR